MEDAGPWGVDAGIFRPCKLVVGDFVLAVFVVIHPICITFVVVLLHTTNSAEDLISVQCSDKAIRSKLILAGHKCRSVMGEDGTPIGGGIPFFMDLFRLILNYLEYIGDVIGSELE